MRWKHMVHSIVGEGLFDPLMRTISKNIEAAENASLYISIAERQMKLDPWKLLCPCFDDL